jgi:O-antigen/teichoic acid export membrane protein
VIFVGNGFNLIIALLTSVLLARILGAHNYGLVALAITSVNFVIQFIDAQTDEALIRFMGNALARDERDEALTFFYVGVMVDILVGLVALLVVILVVPPIIRSFPNGADLEPLVWIFLVTTPFTILQSNFESVFKTFRHFRLNTVLTIIVSLFSLVLLVILATSGVRAVIQGYVIATLVDFTLFSGVAIWLLVRHLRGARGRNFRQVWRQLTPFVFHTSVMGSIKSISVNLDTVLLGALANVSAVTYFTIARTAINLISMPVMPVSTVIFPMLNEASAKGNIERVRYLLKRFILFSSVICFSADLFFLLFADILVKIIYPPDFFPVANLIHIMLIGMTLEIVMGWVRRLALVMGKPEPVTFSNVAAFLCRFVVTIPLIYLFGAAGSAIGYDIGVTISVVINIFYGLPKLGIWNPYRRLRPVG